MGLNNIRSELDMRDHHGDGLRCCGLDSAEDETFWLREGVGAPPATYSIDHDILS